MRRAVLSMASLAGLLAACANQPAPDRSVEQRIQQQMAQARTNNTPPPKAAASAPVPSVLPPLVGNALLPPLRTAGLGKASSRQLEQRFDLVVTEAPVAQVLMSIVSDTPYSLLLSPRAFAPGPAEAQAPAQGLGQPGTVATTGMARQPTELLTLHLKDVTVMEALEAVREMYGYEYQMDGSRIYVRPPELRAKLYQINYILGQRRGVSDLQVIGGASTSGGQGGSGGGGGTGGGGGGSTTVGGGGGGGFSSIQASALSTISKSDVWSEVEDSLRTLLGCQIPKTVPMKQGGSGGSSGGGSGNSGGSNGNNSQGNSSRADVNFTGDSQMSERPRGVDGCTEGRALTVNQMSGTILVRAMPRELRQVEAMLRSMQANIERQVIIEAKIIDVVLNAGAQQGIDWAGLHKGLHRASVGADTNQILAPGSIIRGAPINTTISGTDAFGNTINSTLTTTTAAVSPGGVLDNTSLGQLLGTGTGLGLAIQGSQFAALINFLESQGQVHVLSSPRIATLNNQKAVLKVGAEESFVTSISGGTSTLTSGTSTSTAPTLNYQPFFSGIALDVTPQIDDQDRITLHVHALVNSIAEKAKVALLTANAPTVPFAVNSISETDSVVKTQDGMMVVIGGLMLETTSDNRSKVPIAGEVPVAGALFRKGEQSTTKRELVILLKPTVVKDESDWTRDIADAEKRIAEMNLRKQRQQD